MVSAVIPTVGRSSIHRALRSVYAQSRLPSEIIIVDDAGLVPLRFGSSSVPITVVRTGGRRGASASRNLGAERASGQYVAFLDDDDEWLPTYLEKACAAARQGTDMICSGFLVADHEGCRPEKSAPRALVLSSFFRGNPGLRGSNLFIRRTTFFRIGGFDESLPTENDVDFGAMACLAHGVSYAAIDEYLVVYHDHDGLRLSRPSTEAKSLGRSRFLAKHGSRMSADDLRHYIAKSLDMWGVFHSP